MTETTAQDSSEAPHLAEELALSEFAARGMPELEEHLCRATITWATASDSSVNIVREMARSLVGVGYMLAFDSILTSSFDGVSSPEC